MEIFQALKIQPTPARNIVLALIFDKGPSPFSIRDICIEKATREITLSETAIGNIIRLFLVRGLLQQAGERRCPSRGRPELLFAVHPAFFQSSEDTGHS